MDWDTSLKALEALDHAAGFLILMVSIVGLYQLRLARKSLHVHSLRDARRASSEQIDRYLDRIMPIAYKNILTDAEVELAESFKFSDESRDYVNFEHIAEAQTRYDIASESQRSDYLKSVRQIFLKRASVMNNIEAFAASVMSGTVDEKMVYRAVGHSYISIVEYANFNELMRYYEATLGTSNNAIALYDLWNTRRIKEKSEAELDLIADEHNAMSERIKNLKHKVSAIESEAITPIGVETNKGTAGMKNTKKRKRKNNTR